MSTMRAEAIAAPATTTNTFTAVFEKADEGGYCVFVEELPGAISQGETIEQARENIKDAIELILEVNRERTLKGIDESRVIREQIVIHR
jgi:predicted RNase H-like HicB family nuclease